MTRRPDAGAAFVALLLMLVAVAALWQSREFSPLGAIFPRAIGSALLLAGAIVVWRSLRPTAPKSRGLPRDGWRRGVLLVVAMALWIGLLERAGFVVAGVVAFIALGLITERDPLTAMRLLRLGVAAVVVVVAFQLLFVQGLKVQLPSGSLFARQ